MKINKFNLNNIDLLSALILLMPTFIIIGNLSINLSCFIIIVLGLIKYFEIIKVQFKFYKIHILFLLIFFLINILFSSDYFLSLKGSLGLIRYIMLSIIMFSWFKDNNKNFKLFLFSTLVTILILSGSVFYEYIKINLTIGEALYPRLSGLFFDEKVAGSFISKFLIISLTFFLIDFKKYNFDNSKKSFLIAVPYFAVFLSLDRMPLIMLTISILFFLLFTKKIKFYLKLRDLAVLLIFISLAFKFTPSIQAKYIYTFKQLGLNSLVEFFVPVKEVKNSKIKNLINDFDPDSSFYKTKWASHFITAYEMGKNSFIVGNGIKTFRKDCGKDLFVSKKYNQGPIHLRCATHPHNIYFELFSETGILGLFLFLYLNFLVIKKIFLTKKYEEKIIILCFTIILFFPFQTTGSYFSTFNGIFYFINLAVIAFISSDKFFKMKNIR